jgi:hypothetical protein
MATRQSVLGWLAKRKDGDDEDEELRKKVFHSSAYAAAQAGGRMAVGSDLSFAERKKIEDQRKHIQAYHNSRLIGNAGPPSMAKTYTPPALKS